MEFPVIFIWVAAALVIGYAAQHRGRSGFSWFIGAILISPLLALVLLALMPSLRPVPVIILHVSGDTSPATLAALKELGLSAAQKQSKLPWWPRQPKAP